MSGLEFYLSTLAVYACINGILVLGLNIQFGTTGILNFAYYLLIAIGAYAAGIAALPHLTGVGATFDQYIGGFNLGFPLDLVFAIVVVLVFALLLGALTLIRLRADYLALVLLASFLGLWQLADSVPGLLNGDVGLINIPGPWSNQVSPGDFQLICLGLSLTGLIVVFVLFQLVDRSPLGRAFRAVREDEMALASVGKNPWRLKMIAFLLGAFAAGLGGGLFALYVGGWGPNGWELGENLVLLAAVIVGGRGRNLGAVLGSVLLMTGVVQGTKYLPVIAGRADLVGAIQGVALGIVVLGFLWWRPQGLLAEQKERFSTSRRWWSTRLGAGGSTTR